MDAKRRWIDCVALHPDGAFAWSAGKTANCQVGTSLVISTRTMHVCVDFELYLPRNWTDDPRRRREAQIPDAIDFKIEQDPRVTRVGRWLRRTSLDELPNLLNVLRGDMRLVGPRPTSFNASRYRDHHLRRLSIYPGVTGLWQVCGRSDIDFDERVELDMDYIRRQGPLLDLWILLKTPFEVFNGRGAC